MKHIFFAVVFSTFVIGPALGLDLYMAATPTGSGNCSTPTDQCEFLSEAFAIVQANPPLTSVNIYVEAGNYNNGWGFATSSANSFGSVDFNIEGEGSATTIFDLGTTGVGASSLIIDVFNGTLTWSGITVRDVTTDSGTAISFNAAEDVVLVDDVFSDITAQGEGDLLYISSSRGDIDINGVVADELVLASTGARRSLSMVSENEIRASNVFFDLISAGSASVANVIRAEAQRVELTEISVSDAEIDEACIFVQYLADDSNGWFLADSLTFSSIDVVDEATTAGFLVITGEVLPRGTPPGFGNATITDSRFNGLTTTTTARIPAVRSQFDLVLSNCVIGPNTGNVVGVDVGSSYLDLIDGTTVFDNAQGIRGGLAVTSSDDSARVGSNADENVVCVGSGDCLACTTCELGPGTCKLFGSSLTGESANGCVCAADDVSGDDCSVCEEGEWVGDFDSGECTVPGDDGAGALALPSVALLAFTLGLMLIVA